MEVHWENDLFLPRDNSDRWYTNGTRFSWSSSRAFAGEQHLRRILLGHDEEPNPLVFPYGTFVGQQMYTPRDIRIAAPQPGDRPWAGWLYVGRRYQAVLQRDRFGSSVPVHRLAEVSLGMLGPSSRAEEAQVFIHRYVSHSARPAGWHHQLHDEPTLNLRWREAIKLGGKSFDILPHWGFNVGNVQVFANAGATVRFGRNLCDVSVYPHAPTAPFSLMAAKIAEPLRCSEAEAMSGWHVGAGFDARAVGHNVFLDGNNFKDSASVERRNHATDAFLVMSYRHRGWTVTYSAVIRSREFDGPRAASHRFGILQVAVPFD